MGRDPEEEFADPVSERRQILLRQVLMGAGMLVVAGLFFAQMLGAQLRLDVLWPILVVLTGAILAWLQLDDEGARDCAGTPAR